MSQKRQKERQEMLVSKHNKAFKEKARADAAALKAATKATLSKKQLARLEAEKLIGKRTTSPKTHSIIVLGLTMTVTFSTYDRFSTTKFHKFLHHQSAEKCVKKLVEDKPKGKRLLQFTKRFFPALIWMADDPVKIACRIQLLRS